MCLRFKKKRFIVPGCFLLDIFLVSACFILNFKTAVCQIYGQEYSVGISVIVLPPYTPDVQEYIDDPGKTIVTATNFTDTALAVIFGGMITDNESISIYTNINHEPLHIVTLMPNSTFQMNGNNLQGVFSEDQLVFEGITKEQVIQDQNLPENDYHVCITAYDPYTKMPLSDPGQGCSNVITVTMPGVALIIQPECESNVVPMMPQNVIFSWIPPENSPPNTHYTLKICEIFPGENPHDAMDPSHPVFFETTVLTTSYVLGPGDPGLFPGEHYAFDIISSDPEGIIIFENNGWSEICEFTYGSALNWEPPDTTQLGYITLISPAEADTVRQNPDFHWEVTGILPDHYEIKVFKILPGQTKEQAAFNAPILAATTTALTYTFPGGYDYFMQCHYYCWTVTGYTYSGSYSTTTTPLSFHFFDPYQICLYPCYCYPQKVWFKGPAIKVTKPLDYYPKKTVMEPGEAVAFSVLATDQDLLLYKCSELGTTYEKQWEIADRVYYGWDITETGPFTPINITQPVIIGPQPLTWQPFFTSENTIKYWLPSTRLAKGELKVVTVKITITSSLDDDIKGSVQVVMTGREDGCMDVSFTVTPVVEAGNLTPSLVTGTCFPGSINDKFSGLSATMNIPDKLCEGEISLLSANVSDIDKMTMTCSSTLGCINPLPLDLFIPDPLSLTWSDCGAGGSFPLGNAGPCVAYLAPPDKTDIVIQVTANNLVVDDGGVVFEDRGSACKVDLTIYKPQVIDKNEPAIPEDDELCKGAQTFVNLDNDDQDGKYDIDDSPVKDETGADSPDKLDDELVKLLITLKPEATGGTVKLTATKGGDCIKIWKKRIKEDEYKPGDELQLTSKDGQKSIELWVEGVKPHKEQQGTILKVEYKEGNATCEDEVALTIIGIEKIEWAGKGNSVKDDDNLDNDPNHKNPDNTRVKPESLRVFPDARVVGGAVEANPKNNLDIKITLSVKPVEPVDKHFRSFDVDDPTRNNAPIDNENRENDNRGPLPAGGGTGLFTANSNDICSVNFNDKDEITEFQVTMQPGDNFRIVGNGDRNFIDDLENPDRELNKNNNNDDKQRICNRFVRTNNATANPIAWEILFPINYCSLTLTVWRFLHVETDEMTAPPNPGPINNEDPLVSQRNVVDRFVRSISGNGVVAQRIETTTNIPVAQDVGGINILDQSPGNRRFENGSVTLGNITTNGLDLNGVNFVERAAGIDIPFQIAKPLQLPVFGKVIDLHGLVFTLNITAGILLPGHAGGTIQVAGAGGLMAIMAVNPANSTVTVAALHTIEVRLHDDDDDVAPHIPRTNYMQDSDDRTLNLYADAYIRPKYDGGGKLANNTNTVNFVLNTENPNVYDWNSMGDNNDRYWVAYILASWQDSFENMQNDMDSESNATGGSTDPGGGSLIYDEQIRERGPSALLGDVNALEQRIVTHEVGHVFRLPDRRSMIVNPDGSKSHNYVKDGIMHFSLQDGPAVGVNLRFIDDDINRMRRINRPNP